MTKYIGGFMLELNKIYLGDCLEIIKDIESCSIDLIIADSPYFEICGEFDYVWKTADEYIKWCKTWILECKKILKPTGSFYIWGKVGHGKGMCFPKLATWIEDNNDFIEKLDIP